MLQPPYALIRKNLSRGKVIPFLGAGASLDARPPGRPWTPPPDCHFLPSGRELASYLEELSGFPSSEAALDLARVAQYHEGVAGRGSLEVELHEVFASQFRPGPLHYHLAEYPGLLIVTTNYDDLLETAFRERGKPFYLVIYRTDIPRVSVLRHDQDEPNELHPNEVDLPVGQMPVIFKMHGAPDPADPERDSYVITEDDYVEFLARMSASAAIPALFAEHFKHSHFLFLGYGLRDWNLRVILHKIWKDFRPQDLRPGRRRRRFASWAIQQWAEPLEREFWSRRDLTIYELSIAEFLDQLIAPEGGDDDT